MRKLSYSGLSQFKKSPNHLLAYWDREFVSTAAMAKGSLIHTLVLEPDTYDEKYAIFEGKVRRGKAYDEFVLENKGKVIINEKELYEARTIVERIFTNDLAKDLLNRTTETEKHVEWNYKDTEFHGFVDGIGDDFLFDLKTCKCSEPKAFAKDAFNYGYYLQAAMYLQATGKDKYYILAAETASPYNVQLYCMTKELLDFGRDQYSDLVDKFKEWNGEEIGYSEIVENLDLPNWMKKSEVVTPDYMEKPIINF